MKTLAASIVALGVAVLGARDTPQALANQLLETDRAYAAASAKTDVISGLSAMFRDDVIMGVPGLTFAEGREAAIAALRGNATNATSSAEWAPIRAGISADGLHGFTFGYMTIRREDGTSVPAKYMAYWIKGIDRWRVAAYKRGGSPEANPPVVMMAPALPDALVPAVTDPARIAAHRASLAEAESAFSDDAQVIGLGPAFAKHGSEDAVYMASPTGAFVVSAAAIGQRSSATPSPVTWRSETILVASSGDLGVSLGRSFKNDNGKPTTTPNQTFFTIWRRPSPSHPWKYVAE